MAKTYPDIGTFSPGDILTAATMNEVGTNLDNQRVPPMCKARLTANETSYTTATKIPWDATSAPGFDTDGMWSAGAATKIQPTTAGIYLIVCQVQVTYSGTMGQGGPRIVLNGSSVVARQLVFGNQTAEMTQGATAVVAMDGSTDYIEADVNFTGATSVSILAGTQTYFSAVWLGQAS